MTGIEWPVLLLLVAIASGLTLSVWSLIGWVVQRIRRR